MANYQNDMERMIVESVLAELRKSGAAPAACGNTSGGSVIEDGVINLPDIDHPTLTNAKNYAAVDRPRPLRNETAYRYMAPFPGRPRRRNGRCFPRCFR